MNDNEAREQAWRDDVDYNATLYDTYVKGWDARGQYGERVRAQKDPEVIRARDITQSTHDTTSTVGFTLVAQEPDEEVIERMAEAIGLYRHGESWAVYGDFIEEAHAAYEAEHGVRLEDEAKI